ncbi:BgTH12-03037 [Blumeria graminis f. sp. triticale]|uniref:Bgt-51227 n=2 Tax=Blumeria graminis TaxID=34373 RepID=A0A9X9QDU8_BLUGR|nr:BgTH12-03037 [Blumeria graminis f. sp. triticale]VDB89412.1 Bgt-51227 [Blumeria graminis f. sp. tritici]
MELNCLRTGAGFLTLISDGVSGAILGEKYIQILTLYHGPFPQHR